MLNAFYTDYMNKKKDNGKDSISFYEIKGQARPIKRSEGVKEFNEWYKTPKAFPVVKPTNEPISIINPKIGEFKKKVLTSNPFDFLYGFKLESPDSRPLPNAYRYKSLLNDSDLNIAMDIAEGNNYLEEGEVKKAEETFGNKDRASAFYDQFKERKQAIINPNYKTTLTPAEQLTERNTIERARLAAKRIPVRPVIGGAGGGGAVPRYTRSTTTSSSGGGSGGSTSSGGGGGGGGSTTSGGAGGGGTPSAVNDVGGFLSTIGSTTSSHVVTPSNASGETLEEPSLEKDITDTEKDIKQIQDTIQFILDNVTDRKLKISEIPELDKYLSVHSVRGKRSNQVNTLYSNLKENNKTLSERLEGLKSQKEEIAAKRAMSAPSTPSSKTVVQSSGATGLTSYFTTNPSSTGKGSGKKGGSNR